MIRVVQHNDQNGTWMLNTIIGSVCIAPIIFIRDASRLCFPLSTKNDLCGITIYSVGYIFMDVIMGE
jgi:hypothetical protein